MLWYLKHLLLLIVPYLLYRARFRRISVKGLIFAAIGIAVVVGIVVGLIFAYKTNKITERGAVVANGPECAAIGVSILEKGGTAVDAAIATLFCEGITCPQSMGLGGGFFATIYTRDTHKVETLMARETAPRLATKDMYQNETQITGGLAVAVPGELRGYWALHKQHGKLSWAALIQPSIDLARNGHVVTGYLGNSLERYKNLIKDKKLNFYDVYINNSTGEVYKEGDIIRQLDLAKTLEVIAKAGEDAIYNDGIIGKMLVEDIKAMNGIVDEQDLRSYKVRWGKPLKAPVDDKHTMYTVPLPGSGVVLSFILNLLYRMQTKDRLVFHQRLVESFKHGYGQRTNLGDAKYATEAADIVNRLEDPEFIDAIRKKIFDNTTFDSFAYYGANFSNVEDHGTANIAVLAPNGDAIVVTSTINTIFGAKFRSRTGIILNDEMDDFSIPGRTNGFGIPPSPANFIEPGKMPMSSMCPAIIVDDSGDVRLLIGAAGGSKITTSVASIIVKYLMMNENLNEAVQSPRMHHQLAPMKIQFESDFDPKIIDHLKSLNHSVDIAKTGNGFASLTAIGNFNDDLSPVFDRRRNGSALIYVSNKTVSHATEE